MSSGRGHSVPPVASAAKECHGISADVGEATFCAGLAPATPMEQVKNPRPSQTNSCDRNHIGMAKS
jgi:hypothetical protein